MAVIDLAGVGIEAENAAAKRQQAGNETQNKIAEIHGGR